MTNEEIRDLIEKQRDRTLFHGQSKGKDRKDLLLALADCIKKHETAVCDALYADLGKSKAESYMCEIGGVLSEIRYMVKHLGKFSAAKRVHTEMTNFPAKSYICPEPLGCCLIISPWNYPFLLSLEPLVDAIAAGNSVILRPSLSSPHVARVLDEIVSEVFDEKIAKVVICDHETGSFLMRQAVDKIFFTGSPRVGKEVMIAAAEHYIPVTLELGGKSPCVVDESAKISLAAKRIVFGKFLNAGQTCVAPDYVYCSAKIKDELVCALIGEIKAQYGENAIGNPAYPNIITASKTQSLLSKIKNEKVLWGGRGDVNARKIEPTIVDADFSDSLMQEEIFGPVLPILTYANSEEAVSKINSLPTPLAMYVFAEDKTVQRKFMSCCEFGGGCVNDTIMHLTGSYLPFGGRRQSGMGAYHGKAGFDTFTHYKSVLKKSTRIDMKQRYMPMTEKKLKFIRKFLK